MNTYKHKALLYSENYGILEYEVVGNKMQYVKKYPTEKTKYLIIVNLDTMQETRKEFPI